MLPVIWHRTLIVVSAAIGGVIWIQVQPVIAASDGSTGLSLFSANSGVVIALLTVLLASIPAVLLGVVTAATGHPVTGVFAVAAALALLAAAGGPIDGWMWRSQLPADYGWLIIEVLIWFALAAGLLFVIEKLRPAARALLPGTGSDDPHAGVFDLRKLCNNKTAVSGLITAVIGGVFAALLIRTTDAWQVIGALFVAFMIAGLLGQTAVPGANPLGTLISPVFAAVIGYGMVLANGPNSNDAVLARWYSDGLTGLAQALPIFYVSAGVAGAAMGIGLSRNMDQARQHASQPVGAGI